ncbi:MAG: hypothetical protein EOP54_15365 [Sphingobacteriales bacterium]|nr:MAG: hypothetical protein EOP54_15365 [Sphingobacteriales bacterium]
MQLNFDGLGDKIGIPIQLKDALKEPATRTTPNRLYTKINMPETTRTYVTIEGLRNGQMIGARESLAEVIKRDREAERLEREENYNRLADVLRGYYAFDTDELKAGQKTLQREINLESTRQLIKDVLKESPGGVINVEDVEFKENRPVPRVVTTFTPGEEKLLHNILQKAADDGVELSISEKRAITRMTPKLYAALEKGYPNWKAYTAAINAFRRLGRDVFTFEMEDKIRTSTAGNIFAQREAEAKEARAVGRAISGFTPIEEEVTRRPEDVPRGAATATIDPFRARNELFRTMSAAPSAYAAVAPPAPTEE